jgi:hypothetical protein
MLPGTKSFLRVLIVSEDEYYIITPVTRITVDTDHIPG